MAKEIKTYYRRRLPHWQPEDATIFLTWRLYDSLPKEILQQVKMARNRLRKEPKSTSQDYRSLRHGKRIFALMDRYLDTGEYGSLWLANPPFAQIVENALFFYTGRFYLLWAYVIMANHVHVLLTPKRQTRMSALENAQRQAGMPAPQNIPLQRFTKGLKGYTAREINKLLGRAGEPFWQDESFDHWVRDEPEFYRIVDYIENNPVSAGLIDSPEEWRWSSAWFRKKHGIQEVQPLRCGADIPVCQ